MKKVFTMMVLLLALVIVGKAQTLFEENFNNGIPTTWTNLDVDGDGYVWTDYGYAGVTGGDDDGCASSASYHNTALHPDNWLITPAIQIPASGAYELTFYVNAQDASWAEEHYALMITTNSNYQEPNNYTMLFEETLDANGGTRTQGAWKMKTQSLANYAGQTVHIAFRHYNCTDMFKINLDDVVIALASTDPRITVGTTSIHFPTAPIDSTFENQHFGISGVNLSSPVTVNIPAGTAFGISTDNVAFSNSVTLTPNNGSVSSTIHVKFTPTAANYYETTITVAGETGTWNIPVKAMVIDCNNIQTIPWYETFTTDEFPANCWTMTSTDLNDYVYNGTVYPGVKRYTWFNSINAQYASVVGDAEAYQDEHLYTPTFTLSNVTGAADFAFDFRTNPNVEAMVDGLVRMEVNMSLDGGNTYTNVWNSQDIRAEFAAGWESWDNIWPAHINMDQYLGANNQIKFDFHYVADSGASDQVIIQNVRFVNYHNPKLDVDAKDTISLFSYVGSPETIVIPVEGRNLNTAINVTTTSPFEVSNNGTAFAATTTLPTAGGDLYIRYNPTATGSNNATVNITNNFTDPSHTYADTNFSTTITLLGNAYNCAVITLPITESFESAAEDITAPNATEYCWDAVMGNAADANNAMINSDDYAYVGSKSFRFSSIRANKLNVYDQYLISPELTATAPMLVMFNYANASALNDEVFCVGYSTTGKSISDFTWEADITNSANTDWQLYRNINVPANVKYVAIHYKSVKKNYLYIDNFQIMVAPSCIAPVSVKAESTTTTTADITWTAGNNETAWEMVYGVAPLNVATASPVAVNTLGTTLDNLTANTHYQLALRAVCGTNSTSEWSEICNFWTTTTPATVPYTQTFEDNDADRANWVLVNGNEPNYFMFGTIPASTTGKGLMITNNGTSNTYLTQIGDNLVSNYSTVWAYRDIQFPETTAPSFVLSLSWKCFGEVDYDFGELFVGNATEVTNFERDNEIPGYVDVNTMHYTPAGLTKLDRFVNQATMQTSAYSIPAELVAGKVQRLYFLWTNDSLSGAETPLAVDNISITIPTFCNLNGTVTHDLTQNPIEGAVVTAKNLDNGFTESTTTDNAGNYSFQNLVAGLFEISASANGYVTNTIMQPLMVGDNILPIELSLEPCVIVPSNVSAYAEDDNLVMSWSGINSGVIRKCNSQTYVSAIGGPSAFGCFHRFTPSDLISYSGASITSIGAYFNADASEGVTYTLQIYVSATNATGPSSSIPVYEQVVNDDQVTAGQWNDIPLNTPYLIDGSMYLWIGYILEDVGSGNYPAGVTDAGAAAGDGNIMLSGSTWTTLPSVASSLTYRWMIRANVVAPQLHYNILEDGEVIASNVEGTEYIVYSYDPSACYQVSTICENGMESNPSECSSVGINDVENNSTFEVYPNPVHETVNVSTTMDVQKVEVLNYLGQVIFSQNTTNNNFSLNVANYADGVYFIRISGNDGIATQKLIKK